MTITFMAFFSLVASDRVSSASAARRRARSAREPRRWLLVWTELYHRGDLRAYAVVQFLPLLLMPLMLLISRGRWLCYRVVVGAAGRRSAGQGGGDLQGAIYDFTRFAGGDSLKHVLAAAAVLMAVFEIRNNQAVTNATSSRNGWVSVFGGNYNGCVTKPHIYLVSADGTAGGYGINVEFHPPKSMREPPKEALIGSVTINNTSVCSCPLD